MKSRDTEFFTMTALFTFLLTTVILLTSVIAKEATEEKPLVLYRIGNVPVELEEGDEVGVMLINDGGVKDPSPRYIVAIAKTRTVIDTKNIEVFKATLKKLPKGTTVFSYGTCTVPRSWGLKKEQFADYNNVFIQLGLVISEEDRVTCYCESLENENP